MEIRKGTVNCSCGQIFGFETVRDSVSCPECTKAYFVADYAIQEVEFTEEPEQLGLELEEVLEEE